MGYISRIAKILLLSFLIFNILLLPNILNRFLPWNLSFDSVIAIIFIMNLYFSVNIFYFFIFGIIIDVSSLDIYGVSSLGLIMVYLLLERIKNYTRNFGVLLITLIFSVYFLLYLVLKIVILEIYFDIMIGRMLLINHYIQTVIFFIFMHYMFKTYYKNEEINVR